MNFDISFIFLLYINIILLKKYENSYYFVYMILNIIYIIIQFIISKHKINRI